MSWLVWVFSFVCLCLAPRWFSLGTGTSSWKSSGNPGRVSLSLCGWVCMSPGCFLRFALHRKVSNWPCCSCILMVFSFWNQTNLTPQFVSKSQEQDVISPLGPVSTHIPSRNKQRAKSDCRNKHWFRVSGKQTVGILYSWWEFWREILRNGHVVLTYRILNINLTLSRTMDPPNFA